MIFGLRGRIHAGCLVVTQSVGSLCTAAAATQQQEQATISNLAQTRTESILLLDLPVLSYIAPALAIPPGGGGASR